MLPQRMRDQAAQFTRASRIRSAALADAQISPQFRGYIDHKTSASGTSRDFAASHQFGRFRSEADIQRAAPTTLNL